MRRLAPIGSGGDDLGEGSMQLDDETLMAYADGELSPAAAKHVEAAMAEDPSLASRVRRFRATRRALRTVYDQTAAEAVPDRLLAILDSIPDPPTPAPRRRARIWIIAALMVVALLIAVVLLRAA